MKVLVNIPALNEEKTIGKVIRDIPRTVNNSTIDVLVVNDGSTDNTEQVSKEAGAVVINHKFNKGVGEAFKTAREYFLFNDYDVFVNIDADGQFNPKDIEKLTLPVIHNKADIVIGSRFSGIKPKGMPWIKRVLNRGISSIVGGLLKAKVDDLTCGFRAYSRDSLLKLNLIEPFTYTQEAIISGIGKRMRIKYIPVKVTYFSGRKSRVVSSISKYINKSVIIILRTFRDTRPLFFFGTPALIILGLGLVFGFTFTGLYLSTFKTTPYRTIFYLSIFFLGLGLQLFIFALMADMMKNHRQLTEEHMYMMKKNIYEKERTENIKINSNSTANGGKKVARKKVSK